MTDVQWLVIAPLLPADPVQKGKGHPHIPWRVVCNTILWVLITGSRWRDVPKFEQWSSRSVAHRWLGRWSEEGILEKCFKPYWKQRISQACWIGSGWPLTFFFQREGGGEEIEYGFKGKGTTTHVLVDGNGSPVALTSTAANGDERQQVEPLLDRVHTRMANVMELLGQMPIFEADKGYDANELRYKLLKRRIFPWICRGKKPGKSAEKIEATLKKMRWKVERAISWLQRKFRRLAVRWERRTRYWRGFLTFGLITFWMDRLLG